VKAFFLVKVILFPARYDGKCIQTVGVISVEFEGGLLYLNKESYDARAYENSITQPLIVASLNSSKNMDNLVETYVGKLVRFTGIYSFSGAFRPTINVNGKLNTSRKVEVIEGRSSFPPKS